MEKGTKVLIEGEIVRRLLDNCPEEERGYIVKTSRGEVMVEPWEIQRGVSRVFPERFRSKHGE